MVDPLFQFEVSIICRNKQSVNLLKTCDIMHLESAQAIEIDIFFCPSETWINSRYSYGGLSVRDWLWGAFAPFLTEKRSSA